MKAAAQKTVKGLDSEEKKARALFEWVAKNVQYDVPAYVSKNKPAQSAGAVLTRGSAVAQGYANLYQDMARAVGLKCEVITGIVRKRDRYDSSVEQDRHHVWNAVLVNGHWILVDPTWASGSSDLSALTFKYRFNPQWYDVAPERMIYTHLPDKDKWQLRKDRPPLSQNDFDQLPMAYSGYFHSGLKAKSHPFPQFKAGKYLELQFTSEKRIELSGTLLTHKGERFQRSYVTSQSQGYEHSLYVSIPQDGAYDLWVHTKLPGQDYEPALLYVINAQGIRRSFLGF